MSDEWQSGRAAGREGKPATDNPWPVGTREREEWNRGWWAGYADMGGPSRNDNNEHPDPVAE